MAEQLFEQFDRFIDALLASRSAEPPRAAAELEPLLRIAARLRDLPRPGFRERLKSDLQRRAEMASPAAVAPKPAPAATPYICVRGAAAAIEFYKKAFGAVEIGRLTQPDGRIAHAEIEIGGALIMLADEILEYGFRSPQTIGGSSMKIHLFFDDVDALVRQAVAAGATLTRPIQDEFYGHREGQLTDPFGYTWLVSTQKEVLTFDEIARRYQALIQQTPPPAAKREPVKFREGFHTITPYLAVREAHELIAFVQQAFGAEGAVFGGGSEGGIHAEYRIGDSMLMIGGAAPWKGTPTPTALHLYVPDADAAYARAIAAGAHSIYAPMDQPYGDREGGVRDVAGNLWFIATHKAGASHIREGFRTVTPGLFVADVSEAIGFLKKAFGGTKEVYDKAPDGTVVHGNVSIGDSVMELGEARPEWPAMPSMFYLYVDDADAWYRRAVAGGATSMSAPADAPYGDRVAAVTDPFGNQWYMATPLRANT